MSKENVVFELIDNEIAGIDFRNDLVYSEEDNVYLYKSFYNGFWGWSR